MSGISHLTAEEKTGSPVRRPTVCRFGQSPGRSAGRRRPSRARSGATRSRAARTVRMWRMERTCCAASARRYSRRMRSLSPMSRTGSARAGRRSRFAGRLRLGIEPGLRAVCAETIYGWIYRANQKAQRLWRFLTRCHGRRRKRYGRTSRDTIADKIHISRRY